jgi:hypothetical protein
MFRSLVVMTAGLAFCVALARADDTKPAKKDDTKPSKAEPSKVTVEPVSLSVSKKLEDKDLFWGYSSTAISFKVAYPGKQILGIDSTSKITEFQDDKKTSLLGTGFFKAQFGTSPMISKDRTKMIVYVNTSTNPAKGATKVTLKGSLVVRCGTEEKTTEEKEVEFKNKTEVKMGDFTLKVTQEKGFGDSGASFSIVATKPDVKSVTVKDADGKEVELMSYGHYGFDKSWTYSYGLKKALEKGKVTVTYFSKDEKVTVPVEVSAGLGL